MHFQKEEEKIISKKKKHLRLMRCFCGLASKVAINYFIAHKFAFLGNVMCISNFESIILIAVSVYVIPTFREVRHSVFCTTFQPFIICYSFLIRFRRRVLITWLSKSADVTSTSSKASSLKSTIATSTSKSSRNASQPLLQLEVLFHNVLRF